jgi:hypothetical protein
MDIFKVHILNSNGLLDKIYVFSGKEPFSTPEMETLGVPIIQVGQQIHSDDSIRVIKNKIIHAIGDSVISYNQLYLFMDSMKQIDLMEIYNYLTNNGRNKLSSDELLTVLLNLKVSPGYLDKESYTYEDMLSIIAGIQDTSPVNRNISSEKAIADEKNSGERTANEFTNNTKTPEKYSVKIPIGQKFAKQQDFGFSVNPYTLSNIRVYHPRQNNRMTVFDNMLLLNYGNAIDNVITVCTAENILAFFRESFNNTANMNDYESIIIQSYFPFLFQDDHIQSSSQLIEQKETLLKNAKAKLDKQSMVLYKTIDMFYDIFYNRTEDLVYGEHGIKTFSILLHTNLKAKLPLEVIFKNIHATSTIPFIKYNPGSLRENLYRLFVKRISKNGKKIPVLQESTIMQLSRKIGKGNQISMYIKLPSIEEEFYIDFEENGDIRVYGELKTAVLPTLLSEYISKVANPVIKNINNFLNKSGYSLRLFTDFSDEHVQVLNMKYIAKMTIDTEISSLQKYIKCLAGLFVIYEPRIAKVAKMVFKRVENFKEMDAKTLYIQRLYEKTDNAELIIKGIMDNFQISNTDASKLFAKYLESVAEQQSGKIDEIPGFQTIIYNEPLENKIVFEVDNIIHIEYIKKIHMYIDSFLRITQRPNTTTVPESDINSICKSAEKMNKDIDRSHIENRVTISLPAIATLPVEIEQEGIRDIVEMDVDEPMQELVDEDDFFKSANVEEAVENDEDDALFYAEDEEEAADELFRGGGRRKKATNLITNDVLLNDLLDENEIPQGTTEGPYKMELAGLSLHNPNLFEARMQKREPYLFTTKSGKFTNYSTLCQSAAKKQPIILTDEEKAKIDENDAKYGKGSKSYQHAIKYGTDSKKPFWYICPRFWCLQTNMSMTEEEVRAGKCGTNPYPHNIIPDDADVIPEGAYVVEFKSKKHVKSDGTYIDHNPSVLTHKTADGHCLPCCYSGWRTGLWNNHMTTCAEAEPDDAENPVDKTGKPIDKEKRAKKAAVVKSENYIMGIDKVNIGPGRWGMLPFSVQAFLHTDNSKCISKSEQVTADKGDNCLLRYGVEKSDTQSFLGCVAVMYAYKQGLAKIPTISEMKSILVENIHLDNFVQSFGGSLISTFKPTKIDLGEIDYEKYEGQFMQMIDFNDENQMDLLHDSIASFENFLAFLKNEDIEIDHTYLWDIVTNSDEKLMKGGYNLVILELPKDDLRDNIQIICPTHSSSSMLYDHTKETIMLLKQANKKGTYYELICIYAKEEQDVIKAFNELNAPPNVKYILDIIQKTSNKYCAPLPSLPKQYDFKKNKEAIEISRILKSHNYTILQQVLNYQGKVIGFMVISNMQISKGQLTNGDILDSGIFVPCFPSAILPSIEERWMDDDSLWSDYETTRDELIKINKVTGGKILCSPKMKMLEDGMIVGIITETNQFVPISPISENIFDDNIVTVDNHNYIVKEGKPTIEHTEDTLRNLSYISADQTILTSNLQDDTRNKVVNRIDLETRYFTFFRSIIRNMLNDYNNRSIRKEIMETLDNKYLYYKEKINNIVALLHKLVEERIQFVEITEDVLQDIESSCSNLTGTSEISCFTDDGLNEIYIPKYHLLSKDNTDARVLNEVVYYGRVADELIRYMRIRLFMLNASSYINIGSNEYVIYDNEVLLLQSILNADYFKDIEVFNENDYLKQIGYSHAVPNISQKYANQSISVKEQRELNEHTEQGHKNGQLNIDMVKQKLDEVQGNTTKIWKRIFPKPAEEIVFYSTPQSGFSMLIFLVENILNNRGRPSQVSLTIANIKQLLWTAYSKYLGNPTYAEKIMDIFKIQGKTKLFKTRASFEQVLHSDSYYVTDLDIWMLSKVLDLPIVLFSSTSLKSLFPTKANWLLLGGNYQTDIYYFVRSPNKMDVMEYQLVIPGTLLTTATMREFFTMVQSESILPKEKGVSLHLQSLEQYLENYRKTVVIPKKSKPV